MLEVAKSIGARAVTIALVGVAVGIGNILSSSIHSLARNPPLAKQSFGYAILGFSLTEAIASFAPIMAFLIPFVFRANKEKSFKFYSLPSTHFHISKGSGGGPFIQVGKTQVRSPPYSVLNKLGHQHGNFFSPKFWLESTT